MENATILGISIGTRQCGLVIMRNNILLDWKVKNYTTLWSENKMERIIESIEKLIIRNGVKVICCKTPVHMRTFRIDLLMASLKKLTEKRNVECYFTNIDYLKNRCVINVGNKETYAEYLTSVYPELIPALKKHKKIKSEYYLRIFEAVGAAMGCDCEV